MLTITYYDYLKKMHKCIDCWERRKTIPRDKSGAAKAGYYKERLCTKCQDTYTEEDMKVRKQARNYVYFEGDVIYIEHDKEEWVKEKGGKKQTKQIVRAKTHARITNFLFGGKMGMVPISTPIKHRRDFDCEYMGWMYGKDLKGADGHLICSGLESMGWWPLDLEKRDTGTCPICGDRLKNGKCVSDECGTFATVEAKEEEYVEIKPKDYEE